MKVLFHPRYIDHVQSPGHPESPQRLISTVEQLKRDGLFDDVEAPEAASKRDIASVHETQYIDFVQNAGEGLIDPDTASHLDTYEIAALAAGAALRSAELIVAKKPSFALVRPPGHHATTRAAMGFCYFNNAAICAEKLSRSLGKVAIVDYDVHHGNGTESIFESRDDILYISTHQWGIYPGTGAADFTGIDKGKGYTVNLPFPAGCGDATFLAAYDKVISKVLNQFKPEAVLISLGVDAHYSDPLGGLTLSSPGFVSVVRSTIETAKTLCGNRYSLFLEGGYNPEALAEVISGVVEEREGVAHPYKYNDISDTDVNGAAEIDKIMKIQSRKWKL